MKLTRFYLRQNIEPLGSLCICIGSLPVGLDTSKYKILIGNILGESKFCFVCFLDASKQVTLFYEGLMYISWVIISLTNCHVHSAI